MPKRSNTILDIISFDEELEPLPRRPSFWLDDLFFWTPIILNAANATELPRDFHVNVGLGWGGRIDYKRARNVLSIPVGVACGLHNQYVEQLKFRPSASHAAEVEPDGYFQLWSLYYNWGIDTRPWLDKVIFRSLIEYRLNTLEAFLVSHLDRSALFADEFVDDLLRLARGRTIPKTKRERIRRAITEDTPFAQSATKREPAFDFFISHASEDKESLVRPLVAELKRRGARVWFDEFTLTVGDSLRRSIDRGLAQSRFGVVVLSPAFFAKNWPQYELDGLVAREIEGKKVILPIWHGVSKHEVCGYSPPLGDKVALQASQLTLSKIAVHLIATLQDQRKE